jgi:uncharacterized membrane protein YccF (DUF307 family)
VTVTGDGRIDEEFCRDLGGMSRMAFSAVLKVLVSICFGFWLALPELLASME